MTPEQLQQFQDMQRRLESLERAENVSFIDNIRRRLNVEQLISQIRLGSLFDVDDTGITNGQLLKWNSTSKRYKPANDIDT